MTLHRTLVCIAISGALAAPLGAVAQQQRQPANATTPGAQQPAAGTQARASQSQPLLASDLIGKKVVNAQGKDLGEVEDLAVDIRNNRVHYAMLDLQGKTFAYPMRELKLSADREQVLLNVSEERLERAPGMDRAMWQRRAEGRGAIDTSYDAYWRQTDEYWRDPARSAATPAQRAQPGQQAQQAQPSGPTVAVQPRQDMQLVWASKLIGWNVHNRANDDSIGEIKDVVVAAGDGRVKFAAVDFNDKIGGRDAQAFDDKLHPVPLSAFATRDGQDDLVLQADRAKLQAQHGFDEDALERNLGDRSFVERTERYVEGLGQRAANAATRAAN